MLFPLHIQCASICLSTYNFKQFGNISETGVYYYILVSPQTQQRLPPSSPSDFELKYSPSHEVSICFTNSVTDLISIFTPFYCYTTTRMKDTGIYFPGAPSLPRILTSLTSSGVFTAHSRNKRQQLTSFGT
jgi:hypothetical protein